MALSNDDIKTLQALFNKMENADFAMVSQMYKMANDKRQHHTALIFNINDRVMFEGKRGEIVKGKITKINRKSIKVQADTGVVWTVSPSLLTRV